MFRWNQWEPGETGAWHSLRQIHPGEVLQSEALMKPGSICILEEKEASRQEDAAVAKGYLELYVQDDVIYYLNVTISSMASGV